MGEFLEQMKQVREGNLEVREKLILENIPLVWSMVKRFHYTNLDREELFQIGMVGLLQAVDRFDISYEVRFSTYAVPMILGEMKRFLRDDKPVKITRSIVENRKKIQEIVVENPGLSVMEIAEKSGLKLEDVVLAMESDKPVGSIYETVYDSGESQVLLIDQLDEKGKSLEERVEEQELLSQAFQNLDEEEEKMIRLRFYENKTQTQVGELLHMSQVQVSRMEKKVLKKMRSGIQ